ncbi:SGNH/GDSL hydrolase family protein [Nocardia cyriacigeorgica]|uniref:SGNH/GDSL hydrolase family protein n=1 Tax=Nocardia cyriacigeorgica TaxID=135487 RepID=A0A5R8PAW8_9NOCA|nr:SGNH/GDSL hydrolase family protein [Nocardia cyriacigeorgica]TLG05346.1 SGNH/GDSL hydrolase family protein [Nocardia cyriacigeorgica]
MARSSLPRYSFALAASACLAVLTPVVAHAQPDAGANPVYVALGDSFSAGFAILPLAPDSSGICGRSAVNYPSLVAEALDAARFTDVTCGGAVSADLAAAQPDPAGLGPDHAAQYDAITPDTTLVTVGIGGNDIGLVQLAASCINPLPHPAGTSCAATNTAGGRDLISENIAAFAPTYGTVIEEIRRRAPRAQIVLVGYPIGIRPGGCPGVQPIWPQDATYLQAKLDELNAAMADEAAEHDATFVSLDASTQGHDSCAGPEQRWMVGAIPTGIDSITPLHPSAAGHANTARQVVAALAG